MQSPRGRLTRKARIHRPRPAWPMQLGRYRCTFTAGRNSLPLVHTGLGSFQVPRTAVGSRQLKVRIGRRTNDTLLRLAVRSGRDYAQSTVVCGQVSKPVAADSCLQRLGASGVCSHNCESASKTAAPIRWDAATSHPSSSVLRSRSLASGCEKCGRCKLPVINCSHMRRQNEVAITAQFVSNAAGSTISNISHTSQTQRSIIQPCITNMHNHGSRS